VSAPFVANRSTGKTLLLILGGLGFVAFGGYALLYPGSFPDYIRVEGIAMPFSILAWASLIFFGFCVVVGLSQLRHRGPVIEIGAQGVRWRNRSDALIPWSAFERAQVTSINRQSFVSLWLRDPGAWRPTTLAGKLGGANKAMGFGDIALAGHGTDRRFEDILEAVQAFAPQLFRD
jgi:hypothetical protein